ncbi:MAG TPA: hypothetical protein PKD31_06140, partial [Blastocatellia bacterium]|nr:hypothetical protein [Blastocatellia bacterium]
MYLQQAVFARVVVERQHETRVLRLVFIECAVRGEMQAARSGERGEIILYEKPKSSGVLGKVGALFDRAIGRTDRREQRAVDLISSSLNSILETKRSSLKESLIDRINNEIGTSPTHSLELR